MRLLAIDPGTRGNMGWARFWRGYFIDAGEGVPSDIAPHIYGADEIVFEHPQIYRARHSKGDPNKLLGLVKQIGYIQGLANSTHACKFTEYQPHAWKGSANKRIPQERARALWTENDSPQPPSRMIDAWDAIALGMFHLKRLTPENIHNAILLRRAKT